MRQSNLFAFLVTIALSIPLFVGFVLVPMDVKKINSNLPASIGEFKATRLGLTPDIIKNYASLDNRLSWLRYTSKSSPYVECTVQEATNYDNLHDLYMCRVYSKVNPKRVSLIETPGRQGESSALYEFDYKGFKYCALFSYQTRTGYAIYPAESLSEKLRLLMFARKPCRLIEVATPEGSDREKAIERLKTVASGICGSAL